LLKNKIMIGGKSKEEWSHLNPGRTSTFIVYLMKANKKNDGYKLWYLADYDDDANTGMWTGRLKDAQ
jgi:hypothetical protein